MRLVSSGVIVVLLVALASCSPDHKSDVDTLGQANIYLTNSPADAKCLQVTVAGTSRIDRFFDLSKTQGSLFSLTDLPLGSDMFAALAFGTSCDSVNTNSVPTWQSDPLVVSVSLNEIAEVTLNMRRSVGHTNVSINFQEDEIEDAEPEDDFASPLLNNPDNGHWYQRFDHNMSWHEARDFCQDRGGYLATITTQTENTFIISQLLATGSYTGWLGATDEASEGKWVWVTDEPFDWTNWRGGEPNNACEGENFLMIWNGTAGESFAGMWNDIDTAIVPDGNGFFCGSCLGCAGPPTPMYPICEWNRKP